MTHHNPVHRYMLIPYYMADVFGRITQNRRRNLQFSKIYYDEFIKLVNHYEVLTKEVTLTTAMHLTSHSNERNGKRSLIMRSTSLRVRKRSACSKIRRLWRLKSR